MRNISLVQAVIIFLANNIYAQKQKTDANVVGHVVCCDEHIPFASVGVKGTTIGTVSDETGHYQLVNLPTGEHVINVSMVGYKPQEKIVVLNAGETLEVKFDLVEDVLNINEVVVSADRAEQKRTEAPVIVNSISPKLFNTSQSVTLAEGLNFSPGLRLENNCQNCGFSQVRMNGMEGPYSQILINSRPIFSGLAGVYGLELIPTNMIEKVEVVRGGGSALFGGNAIAGTVNIILKDPKYNSYEGGVNYSLTGVGVSGSGSEAADYSVNFNTSIVSDDHKSGITLYGFTRERNMFDANNDGFSEMSELKNLTFGARAFHRFGYRDKLAIDFFAINEKRAGGNNFDSPLHERDVAEAVTHDMKVVGVSYDRFFRDYDVFSAYASAQFLNRDSYYGAGKSLSDYGNSNSNAYNLGTQYKALLQNSKLIAGIESTGDFLVDKKLGYIDVDSVQINWTDTTISHPRYDNTTITDQSSITVGVFAQYELSINKVKVVAGARLDHYEIKDLNGGGKTKSGNVLSPRLSIMYDVLKELQARVSYSQGYRAPQIFDEDLHIETSEAIKVIHRNAEDLKQETSHSFMASFDFNRLLGTVYTGLLVEGFYTKLNNAFVNERSDPDENGTVITTRMNSEGGAVVKGLNMELKLKPLKDFSFTSGLTLQTSIFENPQEDFNEKRFFRTPNHYGFFALDWDFYKGFCLSTTGNYTGSMLVPYFGTKNPTGELRESDSFYDMGAKLSYKVKLNGASVEFSGGIKNIFNSYQNDFDVSEYRDPAYIYGPSLPRMVYVGFKFGNVL